MDDTTGRATGTPASGASAAPADNALPAGTRLHEFEIRSVIGEGGFSLVYVAFDHTLHRTVALKEYIPRALAGRHQDNTVVVHSARLQPTFEAGMRSFINEARLLAQFDHPALVKVYRFWEGNATAYMAMPLYEGRTLKQVLKADPAQATQAWLKKVLAPVQDALALLHAERCYHRDISPDNIQLLANDAPVLLDFGAARRTISDRTQAFTAILKPSYAPLEQYAEDAEMKQGPWTDVYALAAVMYTAIMQKPPPASVARVYQDPMQPLASRDRPGFDPEFLRAIDRALAVRPEDRIPTMHAFAAALGMPAPRSAPPPEVLVIATDAAQDDETFVAAATPPPVDADATLAANAAPAADATLAVDATVGSADADATLLADDRGAARDSTIASLRPSDDDMTIHGRVPAAHPGQPAVVSARVAGSTPRADDGSTVRLHDAIGAPDGPAGEPTVAPLRVPSPGAPERGRSRVPMAMVSALVVAMALAYAGWRTTRVDEAATKASPESPAAMTPVTPAVVAPTPDTTAPVTAGPATATAAPATTSPATTLPAATLPGSPIATSPAAPSSVTAAPVAPSLPSPPAATTTPSAAGNEPASASTPATAPRDAPSTRAAPPARSRDATEPRPPRERAPAAASDRTSSDTAKGARSASPGTVPDPSPAAADTSASRHEEKCRTLRMRAELGETLTGSDRSAIEKECR